MPFSARVPFTRQQALDAGITDKQLRNRRLFTRLLRGVYIHAGSDVVLSTWLHAVLLVSPVDAVISHFTALRWYGFETGGQMPLHVSTRSPVRSRQDHVTTHRRLDRIESRVVRGYTVTDPVRTLIDVAHDLSTPRLIEAIEWMLHRGLVSFDAVAARANDQHMRGVRRVRQVMTFVREGSESPMETRVRLVNA